MQYTNKVPSGKSAAMRCVLLQGILGVVIALLMAGLFGREAARSAMLAASICLIVNTYFAVRLFRYRGARQVKQFLLAFYIGELTKLAMMVVLMLIAIKMLGVLVMPFLLTVIVLQLAMSFLPLIFKR